MISISHFPTRINPLELWNTESSKYYIKRDDELPFGGSKARKYLSLLPHILKSGKKDVLLKGGPQSNHLLHFTKLLLEKGIRPHIFLKGRQTEQIGNFLLLSILQPYIYWEDPCLEDAFVVEEGGSQSESIEGAFSLSQEILQDSITFDHIIIDAGTGFMASTLIYHFQKRVHTFLLAGNSSQFKQNYENWFGLFPDTALHSPPKWRSFGSVSNGLMDFIKDFAKDTGIFLDPIYSGKLFYFAKDLDLKGNILLIHQGGSQVLPHFLKK
jgi:1-aminocyclopropane-1-carboxylate deaminase